MSDFAPRTMQEMEEEAARLRSSWPDILPPVFSASAMGMLIRCPEQYRQRYVLGLKRPPGAAMVWGRADHEAIGDHFRAVLDTGNGLERQDVLDRFVHYVEQEIEDAGGPSEIQWKANPTTEIDTIKKVGSAMVSAYHTELAPTVEPQAVEQEIEVHDSRWAVPVVGYVDIVEADTLIERKTTSRMFTNPNPDWVWQGRIYQMALPNRSCVWHQSVKHSSDPGKVKVSALLPVAPDALMAAKTVTMLAQAQKNVEHLIVTYGPDEAWPGYGVMHPWACGYCGYRDNCHWWEGAA